MICAVKGRGIQIRMVNSKKARFIRREKRKHGYEDIEYDIKRQKKENKSS